MKQNIFEPLDIKDIAFLPSKEMKTSLAYMHQRTPDGVLHPRNHLFRTPLVVTGEEECSRVFNSGGGGLFARPQEYCSKLDLRDVPCRDQVLPILPFSLGENLEIKAFI